MKNIKNNELVLITGGGFAAGYCAGVAGVLAVASVYPPAAAALGSNPWSLIWVLGSTVYCAGYFEGKW